MNFMNTANASWGTLELVSSENAPGASFRVAWPRHRAPPARRPLRFPPFVHSDGKLANGYPQVSRISSSEWLVGRGADCRLRISKSCSWVSNRHFMIG